MGGFMSSHRSSSTLEVEPDTPSLVAINRFIFGVTVFVIVSMTFLHRWVAEEVERATVDSQVGEE
jgi:hypothetical protein